MTAFIAQAGWAAAQRSTVAGDASNRRYDRLTTANGQTAILMDAPPDKGEDVRPFVAIARHLRQLGLSAPEILAEDAEQGFLLLEDLGDALFDRVVDASPALETTLYSAAVDVLVHLHKAAPPAGLGAYDGPVMTDMALLAFDWYVQSMTDSRAGREAAQGTLHRLLSPLTGQVLIQRDYHAQNLLWLPDRDGVARVGLLDFQDAMVGHPAYDLCSILMDARRDVPPDIARAMIDRYVSATDADPKAFEAAYAALAAQRNLRILGVFTRLCVRDGKSHYVDLIPRVWGHIQTALAHPSLAELRACIAHYVPDPSPDRLQRIKAQCATPTPF